jgi:hypothetical protein
VDEHNRAAAHVAAQNISAGGPRQGQQQRNRCVVFLDPVPGVERAATPTASECREQQSRRNAGSLFPGAPSRVPIQVTPLA